MKYIISNSSIVLFLNGKPVKVSKDAPVYAAIIKAFRLPEAEQEAAILAALDKQNVNKNIEAKGFVINGGEVIFEGEQLPAPLAQKILSLMKENLPVELFKNFWKNLKKNPSSSSVNELYDFLAFKELPITEDGCFLAYKGLDKDFWSISANKNTKVIKGKVNTAGKIYNGVGEVIEIERNHVDDDRSKFCSFGIHAGSYKYGRGFSQGKFVVVKINPKDVVSVPTDCNCQKLRCCGYTVVSEIVDEITSPVFNKKNQPIKSEQFKKDGNARTKLMSRIQTYLNNKRFYNHSYVTIKAIQGIFSPACPSKIEILDAVTALGYIWKDSYQGKIINL